MNWLNIHTDTLRSEEYLGAEPVERATWLNLIAWCVTQENGGIIEGAAHWKDRKWQQICGVTREEAMAESTLFRLEGDDLKVELYPEDKQAQVQQSREAGRSGGKAKTQAKTQAARANGAKGGRPKTQENKDSESASKPETQADPPDNPSETQAETQRKGREGKSKGKGKGSTRENAPADTPKPAPPPDLDLDGPSPTGNDAHDPCARVVMALHPNWEKPTTWGANELRALWEARDVLLELADDPDMRELLRAYLKDHFRTAGVKAWPKTRSAFCEAASDVIQKAMEWKRRTRWRPERMRPRPKPKGDDPPEDMVSAAGISSMLTNGAGGN